MLKREIEYCKDEINRLKKEFYSAENNLFKAFLSTRIIQWENRLQNLLNYNDAKINP